jgi:hypothetical protein
MIRIDASKIYDWESFHSVFAEAFGFPSFYGRNMDAWIDCMSYLDDPDAEMTSVHVRSGDTLTLFVEHAKGFKSRCPEQFLTLLECSGIVNSRCVKHKTPALLALAFNV